VINCLLIDDEPLALEVLADFVNKIPYLKLAGKFEDPLQAIPLIETKEIDLLFLDIRMPDISGIDFFKSLVHRPELIFTTAYSEYAIDGFALKAIDYLLKPVSFEKFVSACNRVKEIMELRNARNTRKQDYFFINAAHKMHKIFYNDILYLEGFKDYTKIYFTESGAPMLILQSLKYFEDMLENMDFIRVHRSYIVPLRKINTLARKELTIGHKSIPVSDNYRDKLFSIISNNYLPNPFLQS
jgi:two-component system, LytTR family, response regulator